MLPRTRVTAGRRGWLALLATVALTAPVAVLPAPAAATDVTPIIPSHATIGTIDYWNDTLIEAFRRQGGGPAPLARAAAMMHAGLFNVVNSGEWSRQSGVGHGYIGYRMFFHLVDPSVNDELAAGIAAHDLLIDALPQQSAFVNQRYNSRYGSISQPAASELAAAVVDRMRQVRAGDGADQDVSYQFDGVPGSWRLTGHLCAEPVDPHWGLVRPFAMTSTTQFRQPLPGGHTNYPELLASDLYADQLNEVKSVGRFDSATRTADQTELAWFWANDLDGTYKPPGQLLQLTWDVGTVQIPAPPKGEEELVPRHVRLSRLFAWTSLAMADATIAAWDQKYLTSIDLWRPQTAIQQADSDGNPATALDPAWQPLSADLSETRFNPCFPAWVSGHASLAGAWAGVMRNAFGDSVSLTATTEDPHSTGGPRSFTSFTAAAEEVALSRVYLGVHFPFDGADGLTTGFGIADHVHDNFLSPVFCETPCT